MKQLTRKQFIKRRTIMLAMDLQADLLEADQAAQLTPKKTLESFPKVSYYKDSRTGEIRVGLSLRGIKLLVKKYPLISKENVQEYYNLV